MWFIIGVVLGIGLTALAFWMRSKDVNLTWYEWLMGVVGLFLLIFTIQNFIGSLIELDSSAAWRYWLVTGIPSIILLVVTWQLAWARRRRTA